MTLHAQHTAEVANLAAVSDRKAYAFDAALLEAEVVGDFWGLLQRLGVSLIVSREYEHFLVMLGAAGVPSQSVLPLPHPSGIIYDKQKDELIVSSTRTPNLIYWLKRLGEKDLQREILPADFSAPAGELFMPYRSTLLPGSLAIHEMAQIGGEIYANVTGHNFIARLDAQGGWERAWWPAKLDPLGPDAFRHNFFQLNSIAAGSSLETSYFSAFSDLVDGPKPWKQGYGPQGKGVIFSGATREVMCRGLTCPHSVRVLQDEMWVCNSGYGEVGTVAPFPSHDAAANTFAAHIRLPGFTRGLAFHGDYYFVGLSKVIDKYEPYAPGVKPTDSQCAVYVIEKATGKIAAGLVWNKGYQIFDIQVLPGYRQPVFPMDSSGQDGVNQLLRYLG